MKGKRGQGIVEFAVVFGAILFFFIMFYAIIQGNQNEKNSEKERTYLQAILLDLQEEISIASGSSDGYIRQFTIPEKVLGKEYDINKSQSYLWGEVDGFSLNFRIPEINGTLKKGINLIRKENGTVFINE